MRTFVTLLFCLIACLVPGRTATADGPNGSLYLGTASQLMVQPYVSVGVLNETSPGVYQNLGPSSEPETIEIFGLSIPFYNAHNYLLLDTGANSILIVDEAAQDLENAGYQTDGLFWEVGVGGYHEYDVSFAYRFSVTGDDGATHYLDGANGQGVRILSNPESVLAAPIADGGVAGLVGMPAMSGRVVTLDLAQDGHEFPSGPIEYWDIWELIALLAGGGNMETSFSNNMPANPGNRYSVPLDNRISFSVEDGRPDGAPPDSPLPVYADVPFLTAEVNSEINGVSRELAGNFLFDTGAQFSMISRRTAFALGLDENGNGNLDDEALGFVEIAGVGSQNREVPILSLDELRLPTEEGVDMVWYDSSDPSVALGVQFIVLDIFPCADIDFNGIVDAADIAIITENMGMSDMSQGNITIGNIDGDNVVSQMDLDIAIEQLGETVFIDGIFGIDMITGGTQITGDIFDPTISGAPFFDAVHFDFRNWENGQGALVFDVNAVYAEVTPIPSAIPGDANGDGRVNLLDIVILSENWLSSDAEWADGDFNGDGVVNDVDITLLAANIQYSGPLVAGDANGDGRVNNEDAALLAAHWLSTDAGWTDGDFNGDGIVNDIDASLLAANWQQSAAASSTVPEPCAAMLAALLGFLLIAIRRRA